MNKIRLGIIGAGGIVQLQYLPFLKDYERAELVAIADVDRLKVGKIADKFGIPNSYRHAEDLVSRNDLDAVIIATPNNTHLPMALAALSNKKHVMIERPIAKNHAEAERIVNAAEANGCILMTAMNLRFRPDSLILNNLISEGELGQVYHIRAGWLKKQGTLSRPPWTFDPRISGGGVMLDLGVQLVDLCLGLMEADSIDSVTAKFYYNNLNKPVEDFSAVCIKVDEKRSISIDAAWEIPSSHTIATTILHAEKGTAWLNPLRISREMHGAIVDITPGKRYTRNELYYKSFENEIKHFIDSIEDNRQTISSGKDSLPIMRVMDMIYAAGRENREIIWTEFAN